MKKPNFPLKLRILLFLRSLSNKNSFAGPHDDLNTARARFNASSKLGNEKFNQKREIAFTHDLEHNSNKLRIYRNSDAKNQKVILYFHGGGMVYFDLGAQDYNCRHLAAMNDCIVVNANYRLAPENQFPAAHDDAIEVLKWVNTNIADFGGDPKQIITMGDSAGANLAASLAAFARDSSKVSPLLGQVLIYPWCDTVWENHQSFKDYGDKNYILSGRDIEFFTNSYFGNKKDLDNPRANLMKQTNLNGLPPAFILTAEFDPLCSEGQKYGEMLKAAGVNVKAVTYPNSVHGFMSILDAQFKNREPLFAIQEFISSI